MDINTFEIISSPVLLIRDGFLEMLKKKNLGQFSKNYITFYSKSCHQAHKKIWVWDPKSGIRIKTYSGSRIQAKKAPDPGSGSATLIFPRIV
jgi:hypothetical protein